MTWLLQPLVIPTRPRPCYFHSEEHPVHDKGRTSTKASVRKPASSLKISAALIHSQSFESKEDTFHTAAAIVFFFTDKAPIAKHMAATSEKTAGTAAIYFN